MIHHVLGHERAEFLSVNDGPLEADALQEGRVVVQPMPVPGRARVRHQIHQLQRPSQRWDLVADLHASA